MYKTNKQEFGDLIVLNIDDIVEVVCISCEQNELLIKFQAQILFQYLFRIILDQMLPLREQLEIMYIRCVLKPVVTRVKKLKEQPNFEQPAAQKEEEKKEGEISDTESEKEVKTEIENLNFEKNE